MQAIAGVPHAGRFIDVLLKSHVLELIRQKFSAQQDVIQMLTQYLKTSKGMSIIERAKIELGHNEDQEEVKTNIYLR